uniref:Uncharacterized protein n=1 Tax=Arundo donax TaxID=35708 RepID=A0A0A9E2T9_ARUDO
MAHLIKVLWGNTREEVLQHLFFDPCLSLEVAEEATIHVVMRAAQLIHLLLCFGSSPRARIDEVLAGSSPQTTSPPSRWASSRSAAPAHLHVPQVPAVARRLVICTRRKCLPSRRAGR